MFFSSDNGSPAHQNVIDALISANEGYATSYGDDRLTTAVRNQVRDIFEAPRAEVLLVGTGSAANVLGLSAHVQPWQTIYCHASSHIFMDECNAPEFYTGGAKMTPLEGTDGKISADMLRSAISQTAQGDVHRVQRGAVSITNLTESGTSYGPDEIQALADIAHSFDLPLHLDGARFANALVATNCTPAQASWQAGVDILSFGGTKNGLIGVEAIVMFDPSKAWETALRRKRGGHLYSKHRYLAAQMQAYLADGLWLQLARQANTQATALSAGLATTSDVDLMYPVQGNMIFVRMPRILHRRVRAAGARYYFADAAASVDGPDDDLLDARLVCSWCTTPKDVDQFIANLSA